MTAFRERIRANFESSKRQTFLFKKGNILIILCARLHSKEKNLAIKTQKKSKGNNTQGK